MQNSQLKEKLWMSVPTKKNVKFGSRSRKIDAAFREVKDVKRRLDFNENDELRSEYHSKLTSLRKLVSPKKPKRDSQSNHGRQQLSESEKVICWSSSSKEYNDLRHNDYFSASVDELASRRDTEPKRRERNYCVVNLSDDPSDFCVVRVDEDGTLQQQEQIRKYGLDTNQVSEIDDTFTAGHVSAGILRNKENDTDYINTVENSQVHDFKDDTKSFDDAEIMRTVLQRLHTKSREKRLRQQVDDIRNTLKDRVLDESIVSADSYSSHVSVDRAVKTLEILSDALKGTEGDKEGTFIVGGSGIKLRANRGERDDGLLLQSPRSIGSHSGDSNTDSLGWVRRSCNRKLSSSVQSSSSSGRHVQTNVPLFEKVSVADNRKEKNTNSGSSRRCQHCGQDNIIGRKLSLSSGSSAQESVRIPGNHFVREQRSPKELRGQNGRKQYEKYGDFDGSCLDSRNSLSKGRKCKCHLKRDFEIEYRMPESRGFQRLSEEHNLDCGRSSERHCQQKLDSALEINDLSGSPESDDGPLLLSELESDADSEQIRQKHKNGRNASQKTISQNGNRRLNHSSRHKQNRDLKYSTYETEIYNQRKKSTKQSSTGTVHGKQTHNGFKTSTRNNSESNYGLDIPRNGRSYKSGRNNEDLLLTLADVQQLHKEVDVRLQGGENDDGSGGGLHQELPGQVKLDQRISRKVETKASSTNKDKLLKNKPPNKSVKPRSQQKQKGVLIPGRKGGIVVSRSCSLDRQSSGKSTSEDLVPEQTSDEVIRPRSQSQRSDSIQMSANITIPDLFGMQITKTFQRPDGEVSPDHLSSDVPERRRLNLSFEESVDGEIKSVQCEIQGIDLENLRRTQVGEGLPALENNPDMTEKAKAIQKNNKNKMSDRRREGGSQLNEEDIIDRQEVDVQKRSLIMNNDSLKNRFLSNCVDKLENDFGKHIEDYNRVGRRKDSIGPASVIEPPERDTSTPHKKFEPYQGHPLLSGSQASFLNQSSNSAADTIMAHLHNPDTLQLLKNLYQADDSRRKDLIVMTQHFKMWQTNARRQKQHREDHDLFMHRAQDFIVTHLRKRYFYTWHELAHDHRQERIASALFRHHMLKKGLDAFRWAISRSLHRQDMMKVRVHNIQLSAAFTKWRERAEARRQQRLQKAIRTWRDFTLEAQRARTLRKSLDQKLLQGMMGKWRDMYQLRVKQHKADYYRRHTLLSHMWLSWSDFTSLSIQKRSRQQRAVAMYREHLQRRILEEMRQMHHKHLRAKTHFRIRTLVQIFQCWRQSAQVCKVERQRDMSRSREHWHAITLKHFFLHWRETLWNLRAKRMAERTISSHTFTLWKEKWRMNTERRQRIEKQIEMNKLRRSVLRWYENVVLQKRRQAAAIYSLENVLLRQVLGDWRWYTGVKVDMRQRMREHIRYYNSLKLSECFRMWKKELENRLDEQTAQKFWSHRCARKASNKWQLICRKRRLKKTLAESEPLRELTLQHVMFMRWLEAKQKIDREKTEAATMRILLQRCQLQRRFQTWRIATQLSLTIKPLQQRRNHKLVVQCFDGWHQLMLHKRECRQSRDKFLKSRMQKTLNRWRRQYAIHQIECQIKHRMLMGLALVCLQEWNFVIHRKHAAQQFHDVYLLRDMFKHWKHRSARQIRQKALAQAEKERKENLKSYYFALWWSNVQDEISEMEEAIMMLQQRQAHNRIRHSFVWWRTHLRHTRSGRAYHRILCQRSMRTVLLEWHLATDNSLSDAVQNFREELGLPVVDEEIVDEREAAVWNVSEGSIASSSGFHSNKELTLWPDFEDSVDRDSNYSPRSTTSVGLAFRRMLAGDSYSALGSDQGDDGQLVSGVSNSQLTVMDKKAEKRERIKNLVITAVTRLRLWPVSVVFDQWLEFTARQRELKLLAAQLCELHRCTQLTVFLQEWKSVHADMIKANDHFNKVLSGKAVRALVEYRKRRAEKEKLSALAGRYNRLIVYRQFFPVWMSKTQERHHQHHILHLWSTTTQEEQELIPFELQLQQQFSRRTLRLCYAVWSLKFQFASKIKHAYHSGLLKRTLSSWRDWSVLCQERRVKCDMFRQHRVRSLVFKMWQKRLDQKRESHRRYTETWQSYLHLVIVKWQQWAKVNHERRLAAIVFVKKLQQRVLRQRLLYWQSLTVKTQAVQQTQDAKLTKRVFSGWQDYVTEKKRTRQKILQFQVYCYTNLVKLLFKRWRQRYMGRLRQKAEHDALVQMSALQMGREWRRKAQASRGRRLHVQLQENKVRCYFSKWKNAYQLCLERDEVLERYLVEKSRQRLRVSLETWRTKRLADQAGRVYNMKLQMAVLDEWRIWTKGARERRIRGLALQKALQERLLTVYYRYWCEVTRVRQMVQNHSHLKLQLRVLQAWRKHTQRERSLRQLEAFLTKKVNQRLIQSAFVTMRCRFDYCQGLTDMATALQEDREKRLMTATIRTWQARLDRIMAARCYGKFLVVRTVRQWRRYVQQRRDERKMEREKMDLATKHYNKKLCKNVMQCLRNEVHVKHHLSRRKQRLARKYGQEWKKQSDMAYTAACLEKEHLYSQMWTRWRVAFCQRKAACHVGAFEKRHLMSQVFTAWRRLVSKKPLKQRSSIPIATSSSLHRCMSPTGSSSPPVRTVPSQIPSLQSRQFYTNRK